MSEQGGSHGMDGRADGRESVEEFGVGCQKCCLGLGEVGGHKHFGREWYHTSVLGPKLLLAMGCVKLGN